MAELLAEPYGPGPDGLAGGRQDDLRSLGCPGQQGLAKLEAAASESERAEEELGNPLMYHRALGNRVFVECHEGSVALPRNREGKVTFFDDTGQE